MNTHPVNKLYAWLSLDEQGNEGIVTIGNKQMILPLVASEEHLLKQPSILSHIGKIKDLKIVWGEFERKHIQI